MTGKTKYLTYIEETKKHHGLLAKLAKTSTKKAVMTTLGQSIPVTYMEGEEIIKVNANGKKVVVGTLANNRRKVNVGAKASLSKK